MFWTNARTKSKKIFPISSFVCWFFFIASTLFLLYVFYLSEIALNGNERNGYIKYYQLALFGILFWGISIKLREDIKANLITIVSSILLTLYIVEIGLVFMNLGSEPKKNASIAKKANIEWDDRSQSKVVEDLIYKGIDAVLLPFPAEVMKEIGDDSKNTRNILPLGGLSNKTTVVSNELGQYMIYKSDRYGFNNPDDQWDADSVQWLLIGDSFAQGLAVQSGEDIASNIRSLTNTNAITLGMASNGPLIEYASVVEYGKNVAADKVIWIYYEDNDLPIDIIAEKKIPILMKYMNNQFTQNLIQRQEEIDSSLETYIDFAKTNAENRLRDEDNNEETSLRHSDREKSTISSLKKWIKLSRVRKVLAFDSEIRVEFDYELFSQILIKTKDEVEAWGGNLYFVYLPTYSRYKRNFVSHDEYFLKSEVINLVKGLNINVIDLHEEVFENNNNPLSLFPFKSEGHYTPEGYSAVARAIISGAK